MTAVIETGSGFVVIEVPGGIITEIGNAVGGGGGTELPDQTGFANDLLTTDGAGNLSWTNELVIDSITANEFNFPPVPRLTVFAGDTLTTSAPSFRSLISQDVPFALEGINVAFPAEFTLVGGGVIGSLDDPGGFRNIIATWANETANKVFAGPASGSPDVPSFRALVAADLPSGTVSTGANPSASVGLTAVAGTATTFLRSDGAPPISQSITPVWTGVHRFNTGITFFSGASQTASITGASGGVVTAGFFVGDGSGLTVPMSSLSGTLPISQGGTGQITGPAAFNAFAPSQSGNAGKVMTTDGTNPTWGTAASGTVTSVGLSLPADFTVSGSPVTASGTLTAVRASQTQNKFLASPSGSSGSPSYRAMVTADLPSGTGTVTSVALAGSGVLHSISGSPVTSSGTITLSLLTQTANQIFAGPTTGSAATPTWRSLVAADLPAGLATVTSVGLSVPGFLSVSGSPVTTSGTLAVSLATQSANLIMAGPSSGSAAAPTFRSIANADYTSVIKNVDGNAVCDSSGNAFPMPATFAVTGAQTTGTNKTAVLIAPFAGKIVKCWLVLKTGNTGADFITDILLNGTTIFSGGTSRPTITAGGTTGNTTGMSTTTFAAGDQFTLSVSQVGSTIAGSDLTVVMSCLMKNN